MRAFIRFPNKTEIPFAIQEDKKQFRLLSVPIYSTLDSKVFNTMKELIDYYSSLAKEHGTEFIISKTSLELKEENKVKVEIGTGKICKDHSYASMIKVMCQVCNVVEEVPNVDFTESRIEICEHKQQDLVHICDK